MSTFVFLVHKPLEDIFLEINEASHFKENSQYLLQKFKHGAWKHAWVKYLFKEQEEPIDFNVSGYIKLFDMVSDIKTNF